MKNAAKRIASVILTIALLLGCATMSFAQDIETEANQFKLTCPYCGEAFINATTYNLHLVICEKLFSSDFLIYFCSFCGQQFESKMSFVSHTTGCSMKDSADAMNPEGNTCFFCGERFFNEKEFNNHIQICCPVEKCEECGKEVVSKYHSEHLDDCAPVKEMSFWDKIVAFFERILNFFRNIF